MVPQPRPWVSVNTPSLTGSISSRLCRNRSERDSSCSCTTSAIAAGAVMRMPRGSECSQPVMGSSSRPGWTPQEIDQPGVDVSGGWAGRPSDGLSHSVRPEWLEKLNGSASHSCGSLTTLPPIGYLSAGKGSRHVISSGSPTWVQRLAPATKVATM